MSCHTLYTAFRLNNWILQLLYLLTWNDILIRDFRFCFLKWKTVIYLSSLYVLIFLNICIKTSNVMSKINVIFHKASILIFYRSCRNVFTLQLKLLVAKLLMVYFRTLNFSTDMLWFYKSFSRVSGFKK